MPEGLKNCFLAAKRGAEGLSLVWKRSNMLYLSPGKNHRHWFILVDQAGKPIDRLTIYSTADKIVV